MTVWPTCCWGTMYVSCTTDWGNIRHILFGLSAKKTRLDLEIGRFQLFPRCMACIRFRKIGVEFTPSHCCRSECSCHLGLTNSPFDIASVPPQGRALYSIRLIGRLGYVKNVALVGERKEALFSQQSTSLHTNLPHTVCSPFHLDHHSLTKCSLT